MIRQPVISESNNSQRRQPASQIFSHTCINKLSMIIYPVGPLPSIHDQLLHPSIDDDFLRRF